MGDGPISTRFMPSACTARRGAGVAARDGDGPHHRDQGTPRPSLRVMGGYSPVCGPLIDVVRSHAPGLHLHHGPCRRCLAAGALAHPLFKADDSIRQRHQSARTRPEAAAGGGRPAVDSVGQSQSCRFWSAGPCLRAVSNRPPAAPRHLSPADQPLRRARGTERACVLHRRPLHYDAAMDHSHVAGRRCGARAHAPGGTRAARQLPCSEATCRPGRLSLHGAIKFLPMVMAKARPSIFRFPLLWYGEGQMPRADRQRTRLCRQIPQPAGPWPRRGGNGQRSGAAPGLSWSES